MSFFDRFFSKSRTVVLHITSANGFHLRPAAVFASEAKKFSSSIEAESRGKSINAKNLNALLSLGLESGEHFDLICKGKDAIEAAEHLSDFFAGLMQNDEAVETFDKKENGYDTATIEGEIISRGIALAPAFRYAQRESRRENSLDFREALLKAKEALETDYQTHEKEENAAIYLAQKELLSVISGACDSLENFEATIAEESARLVGSKMEAKITDYKDILQRVKTQMGIETQMLLPEGPAILLAHDLLPSQIEQLKQHPIEGVVLKETTLTSHTAILLRASGIPSLIADYAEIENGSTVILDADSGCIVPKPGEEDLQKAEERQRKDMAEKDKAFQKRFEKALTRAKKQIRVFANVADAASAETAKEEGAEGIGLLRSEFLFKEQKPSLDTQTKAYREIFALFDEITVRTLDVGGDKKLPYLSLPEEANPFLGVRGVRLFKTHPELLEEQLHAIFLAAQGKAIKMMFPMISTIEEFTEAKTFAEETAKKYGLDISSVQFGIMVEVPSVLFLIPEFNEVVDFYSIGTNDLTQYLFAIERTHPSLKVDAHSPVIYDAIKSVVEQSDKPVSICGELAADPRAIPRLLKLGIETLSVSPAAVANTKEEIRDV